MEIFFSSFHFLRPELLLLLIALPVLYWMMLQAHNVRSGWNRYFNHRFLARLQSQEVQKRKRKSRPLYLLLVFSLLIMASAGPAWKQTPQPVQKKADNLIVILDLSISMLAKDTVPSRLIRARQKIQDLLQARDEGNTALIAYSGDSHVVTPLTDDTRTIISHLSVLEPLMMPVIGSRPDLAINQSLELIQGAQAGSVRLLLVTDHVAEHHVRRITDSLKQFAGRDIQLDILSIGTAEGGPIEIPGRGYLKADDGSVVIAQTNEATLSSLARSNGGSMHRMTLDDEDLAYLALLPSDQSVSGKFLDQNRDQTSDQTNSASGDTEQEPRVYDQWEDAGYLLLLLAMVLIMFKQRHFLSMILICTLMPQESHAFEWKDLWSTPDQQGSELLQQQDYAAAAEKFESPHLKGDALYRSGDFESAAKVYEQAASIEAEFNKANSLAKAGRLQEALEAYNSVLKDQPGFEDAQFNKEIVEQLLQQQSQAKNDGSSDESGESSDGDPNQDQSGEQNEQQDSDSDSDQKEQGQQDQQRQDEQQGDQEGNQGQQPRSDQSDQDQSGQQEQSGSQQSREQDAGDPNAGDNSSESGTELDQETLERLNQLENSQQEAEEPSDTALSSEGTLSDEEKRSYEQWMRRVPDDPSGLLRRKFEQQARERGRNADQPGEPLW